MATRRTSRPTAQRRPQTTRTRTTRSLNHRPLRFEPLEDRRMLALFTVDTLSDSINSNDDLTSLREAVLTANLLTGHDTIEFAPELTAAGPATILLTQGELRITDSLAVSGPGAELLTIDASGNDPTPTINDGRGTRIYNIGSSLVTTLSGQTLTGGDTVLRGGAIFNKLANLTIQETVITGNATREFGGGIYAGQGTISLESTTISNNVAASQSGPGQGGGGVFIRSSELTIRESAISGNYAQFGGGLYFLDDSPSPMQRLVIVNSSISENHALSDGGGLWARLNGGSMTITESNFVDNAGGQLGGLGRGGGIYADLTNATATVNASKILKNTGLAAGGGWFRVVGGELLIVSSHIASNRAFGSNESGGGLYVSGSQSGNATVRSSTIDGNSTTFASGGGISAAGLALTVDRSTLSGNSARANGGGIFHSGESLRVLHSTITGNIVGGNGKGGGIYFARGPSFVLDHSIIAGNNVLLQFASDLGYATTASTLSVHYSLIGSNTGIGLAETVPGIPDANGNLIGGPVHGVIDPLLGPLADNGGPTLTHALLAGSPAINAGDLNAQADVGGVPLYDQRGEPFGRVVGGRIDIGAFEHQEPSDLNLLVDTLVDESDGNYTRGDLSLREAIELANLWSSTDTIRFDPALTAAGPATILLTEGELQIADSLTITGPGADLLTLDASGNDPTPRENNGDGSRVFNIDDGKFMSRSEVTFIGLTLTGGDATGGGGAIATFENLGLVDSTISGNSAVFGAGIFSRNGIGGTLTITRSVIQDNSATYSGGGIYSNSGRTLTITNSVIQDNSAIARGGGIFSSTDATTVTILSSEILRNTAGASGGGLWFQASRGRLEVTDSVVGNNTAHGGGGGMSVAAGTINIHTTSIRDNYARSSGGGIVAGGAVTISDSSIIGNSANTGFMTPGVVGGGGIAASGNIVITATTISGNSSKSTGGGILHLGTAIITGSTISNNSAITTGGGIAFGIGNQTVTNSAIRDNAASGGGGISTRGGLVITNSVISGNLANGNVQFAFARHGGGIRCYDGTLVVAGATISGNSSKYDGGGVWGGINTIVTITNSTVSGNSARMGGGVGVTAGAIICYSTIVNNSAQILGGGLFSQSGALELQHTIVAANSAPTGRDATGLIGTTIVAKSSLIGWNSESELVEAPVGSPDANGNFIGGPVYGVIDPLLRPLVNNGGPTMTHALLPGSPAINAGDPSAVAGQGGVPVFDQRGEPFGRVFGGRIDIGAFEAQPNPLTGDYNFNGVVDTADYIVWRSTLGSTTDLRADGNEDGVVNDADLAIWRANFGNTRAGELAPTTIAALPTPTPRQPPALPGVSPALETVIATPREKTIPPAEPGAVELRVASDRRMEIARKKTAAASPIAVKKDAALVAWLASREGQGGPRESVSRLQSSMGSDGEHQNTTSATALDCVFDEVGVRNTLP